MRACLPFAGPAFVALVCAVAALAGIDSLRSVAADAKSFHYPELRHFFARPIGFESAPGFSGPIPGYHWFHANLLRLAGGASIDGGLAAIRILHALVGIAAVGTLCLLVHRVARGAWAAAPLSLLLAVDYYALQSTYYFNTEAPMYLFFALLAWRLETAPGAGRTNAGASGSGAGTGLALGVLMLGLVLTRHAALPVAAAPLVLLAAARNRGGLAVYAVFLGLALLVVYSYYAHWGGLVSPYWQVRKVASGFYPHSLMHVLALCGLFGVFFYASLAEAFRAAVRAPVFRVLLAAAAALVLAVWLIAATDPNPDAQRHFSVVWQIAGATPLIGDRSPAVLLLALAAAPLIALMGWRMIEERRIFVEAAMSGALLGAQMFQNLPYQRYVEVPLLFALVLFTARFASPDRRNHIPLVALVAGWGVLSVLRLYGAI